MSVEEVVDDLMSLVEMVVVGGLDKESAKARVFFFSANLDVFGDVLFFEVGWVELLHLHFRICIELRLECLGAFRLRDAHVIEVTSLCFQHLIIKSYLFQGR